MAVGFEPLEIKGHAASINMTIQTGSGMPHLHRMLNYEQNMLQYYGISRPALVQKICGKFE